MTQFFPIFLFLLIAVVGVLRAVVETLRKRRASVREAIFNQTVYAELVLSYIVLPSVAGLQFKALNCQTLSHDQSSFLIVDSSIDCHSASYERFRSIVILGILVYQSIPLLWFACLWRVRRDLNPRGQSVRCALLLRKGEHHLKPYFFLFSDFVPSMWAYEVIEVRTKLNMCISS